MKGVENLLGGDKERWASEEMVYRSWSEKRGSPGPPAASLWESDTPHTRCPTPLLCLGVFQASRCVGKA